MDQEKKAQKPKTKRNTNTSAIRVSGETRKLLTRLLEKANKKSFGKKVKANELLLVALKMVSDNDLKLLQEESLSNADKLEMAFKQFKKSNGSLSKDDFLGHLLNGKSDVSTHEDVTNNLDNNDL